MKKLFLLAVAGLVVLFLLLIQWAGVSALITVFMAMDPLFIPLIFFMPFATLFVYILRWNLLLKSSGVNAKLRKIAKYAFIGAAFNNVTPFVRFGGEPFKCYMLADELKVEKRKVLVSLTADSFITGLTLLVLVYFGALSLAMFNVIGWFTLFILLTLILLPLSLGIYLIYDKRVLAAVAARLTKPLSRFSPKMARSLPSTVMEYRDNISLLVKKRDVMLSSLFLGFIERGLEVMGVYVILLALGVHLSFYECAMVLGAGILAGMIPLLPGGLVAYESTAIFVLGLLGVGPAIAATSILLWRAIEYWLITGLGFAIAWLHGTKFAMRKVGQSVDIITSTVQKLK